MVVLDDLSIGKRENLAGIRASLVKGSITDIKLLGETFADTDYVFHLAAIASVQRALRTP